MPQSQKFAVFASLGVGVLIGVALMTVVAARWATLRPRVVGSQIPYSRGLTAGQLALFCRGPADEVPAIFCAGFVAGAIGGSPKIASCLPEAWGIAEARGQFLAWSDLHPRNQYNPAAPEVLAAQPAVFQCDEAGGRK